MITYHGIYIHGYMFITVLNVTKKDEITWSSLETGHRRLENSSIWANIPWQWMHKRDRFSWEVRQYDWYDYVMWVKWFYFLPA